MWEWLRETPARSLPRAQDLSLLATLPTRAHTLMSTQLVLVLSISYVMLILVVADALKIKYIK